MINVLALLNNCISVTRPLYKDADAYILATLHVANLPSETEAERFLRFCLLSVIQ